MADLLTHGCIAVLCRLPSPDRARLAVFVAGTCAPDILGLVPGMALARLRPMLPWLPESLLHLTTPLHLPVGVILSSYLLAHLFAERHRVGVFRDLLAGGLLHLGVDLLQSHLGVGYALLFPFSLWQGEIGWFGSEATVTAAPALVLVTSVLAAWRWGRPRPHTAGGGALRAHPTDGAAWSSR